MLAILIFPYIIAGSKKNPGGFDFAGDFFRFNDFKIKTMYNGNVVDIPLKEYIYGSVAAEILPNSPREAIKAQSAAIFSYTISRMNLKESHPDTFPEHGEAYICNDPSHCKAYITKDEAYLKWGREYFNNYWNYMTSCVDEVVGKVITFEGKVIDAVFFCCSNGRTEDCENVWGSEAPYLKSVDSNFDENCSAYLSTAEFDENELKRLIKETEPEFDIDILADEIFLNIQKSENDYVLNITAGEMEISGQKIRKALSLRSTSFSVEYKDGVFYFTVKGYGHGVGMSQNGAVYLARTGMGYEEILKYYYTGITIEDYIL